MKQFQISKTDISKYRTMAGDSTPIQNGEILLKVEKFGLSTNNVTYAVAGDTLGYWQFFKPVGGEESGYGLMPVWGFAEVVQSAVETVSEGERLFGYFPPADYVVMQPTDVSTSHFFDGSEHRSHLPKGYNIYRRVNAEPGYDISADDMRMLLYPLYVTSFVIADQLQEFDYYDSDAVIVVSASSKTSIGLGYALKGCGKKVIGLTSEGNAAFVEALGIYDTVVCYSDIQSKLPSCSSVIVDMAGNGELLGDLHQILGSYMKQTLSVGLTHWEAERRSSNVIKDRTEFFFAPSRIQKRIKEWGAVEFQTRSSGFVMKAAASSMEWLELKKLEGLENLETLYPELLAGKSDPKAGFLFYL